MDHSNEISLALLSHGTTCFGGFEKIIFEVFLEFLLWPLQSERAYILLAGLAITQIQEWSADTT